MTDEQATRILSALNTLTNLEIEARAAVQVERTELAAFKKHLNEKWAPLHLDADDLEARLAIEREAHAKRMAGLNERVVALGQLIPGHYRRQEEILERLVSLNWAEVKPS